MTAHESTAETRRRQRHVIDPIRVLVVLTILTALAWLILTQENVIEFSQTIGFREYDPFTGTRIRPDSWIRVAFLFKTSLAILLASSFMYYYLAGRFSARWLIDTVRKATSSDTIHQREPDIDDDDDGQIEEEDVETEFQVPDSVATLTSERDLFRAIYYIEQMRERLQRAIESQVRNSNLNLILGILTAGSGISVLFMLALEAGLPSFGMVEGSFNAAKFWGSLASRYSLALTIQVFAVFFLLTYRRNLIEIKYFNNELTNIEATIVALKLATSADDTAARMDALIRLARTERNPILTRDQRTVDLTARRQDDLSIQNLVDSAIKAFNAAAKREGASPE